MRRLHGPSAGTAVIAAMFGVLILCVSVQGCSGSSAASGADTSVQTPPPESSTGSGAAAEPEFPPGKFTVQLGAYQSEDAARKIAATAGSRFSRQIYTVYDAVDHLYKVMLGMFDTKDLAREFRDTIVRQYAEDYRDAWVSELTR